MDTNPEEEGIQIVSNNKNEDNSELGIGEAEENENSVGELEIGLEIPAPDFELLTLYINHQIL
eukprot:8169817-Ditylum_brightwellii.AAC.2